MSLSALLASLRGVPIPPASPRTASPAAQLTLHPERVVHYEETCHEERSDDGTRLTVCQQRRRILAHGCV